MDRYIMVQESGNATHTASSIATNCAGDEMECPTINGDPTTLQEGTCFQRFHKAPLGVDGLLRNNPRFECVGQERTSCQNRTHNSQVQR
eukprot:3072077-Prymnesium_polylepis.1